MENIAEKQVGRGKIGGKIGISASTLYIIAMATMTIDHLGYASILPIWSRIVGRIAFPIFAYMLVEGVNLTRNINKYILRLAICAVLSEIPFNLMVSGHLVDVSHQSVMIELLIGIMVVYQIKNGKHLILNVVNVVLLAIASEILNADYGVYGIMLILAFSIIRDSKYNKLLIPISIWVIFGLMYKSICITHIFGIAIELQTFAVMASIPLMMYNGKQGINAEWFKGLKYIYYPLHIAIIVTL